MVVVVVTTGVGVSFFVDQRAAVVTAPVAAPATATIARVTFDMVLVNSNVLRIPGYLGALYERWGRANGLRIQTMVKKISCLNNA